MRFLFRLLFVASLFVISGKGYAQYGSFGLTDARQLGLGNTYASNCRELYAAGKNPSLLAYSVNDRKIDFMFPNLSLRAYNISSVTEFFNDYFSQKPLEILTSIDGSLIKKAFENEGKLYLGLQIGYLAGGYTPNEKTGAFSLAMKDYLTGFLKLPLTITEYYNGEHNFKGLYFKDFQFISSWMRAYELSYGKMFRTDPGSGVLAVYGGIGLKYLVGFSYHKIEFSGGAGYEDASGTFSGSYTALSLSATSDDMSVKEGLKGGQAISNVPFMEPVGRGFGVDVGVTMLLDPGVRVGLSLTDAGLINWKGKTRLTEVSGTIKIDSTLTIEDIDSLANNITIVKQTDDDFTTNPPSAIHIGFSFMIERFFRNFPGQMNLAVELHQGVSKSLENPDQPRLAVGLDWKPGRYWPIFLTGITQDLQGNLNWSIGLGYELNFLELYIASPNIVPQFQGSDVQTLSISACWHFVKQKKRGPAE